MSTFPVILSDGSLWTASDQAWADQAIAEQAEQFRREAEDNNAMAGYVKCSNCSGTGFDAEPDGMGGAIGGPCDECKSSGVVKAVLSPITPNKEAGNADR